jgi:hypothetical protein
MRHDPTGNFTQTPELYTKDKLQPSRPEPPNTIVCSCGCLLQIRWP